MTTKALDSEQVRVEHFEHNAEGDAEKSLQDNNVAIQTDTFAIDAAALGDSLPPRYYLSPNFIGTITALCLGNISNYVGWVLPSNSLALINADIGPSKNISWIALGFTLGLSVGFLIVGRLSDIFGRRWFFIIGNLLSLIGSIVSATAKYPDAIIGGSVLTGLAGSVQLSFSMAIGELVTNKARPLWISGIFMSSLQFASFGPVIAQTFVTNTAAGWRWSFYINIIVSGLAAILLFFFYHPPSFQLLHKNRSRMDQLKRLDFIGLALFTSGLVLFLMGLSWGGQSYPWKSAQTISTIVVGAAALVAFVLYDTYLHQGDALLPMHLFKSRGYLAMVMTGMVGSCVYYSMNVLWPQQIAFLFPGTPEHNGWLACIIGSATLVGQILGGILCTYVKRTRYFLITSCASLLCWCAAMIAIQPGDQNKGIAFMFLACCSVGIIEACAMSLGPLACATEDLGLATGALGSIRSGGAAVATAIFVSVLGSKLTAFVPALVAPAALGAGLPESSLPAIFDGLTTGDFSAVKGATPKIIATVMAANAQAAANAFRYVWYAVIPFACLALLASCLTIDYGQYLTDDVSRKLQEGAVSGEKEIGSRPTSALPSEEGGDVRQGHIK